MRFNLTPLPRVIFLRVSLRLPFDGVALGRELSLENYMLTSFVWPAESMVEDLLAPLYEEDDDPIRGVDRLRATWNQPIPGFASPMLSSPQTLTDLLIRVLPFQVFIARLKNTIATFLGNPEVIPLSMPGSVVVTDATSAGVRSFFSTMPEFNIAPEHCLFIRLVDDNVIKTFIFEKVPCRSINLIIPPHSSAKDAARIIETSSNVTPPDVEFSISP
jgi:hypothetical protein